MNKRPKKQKSFIRSQMIAGTSKQTSQDNFDNIPMSRQLKAKKQSSGRLGRIKRAPINRTMNKRVHTQNQPLPTFKDLEKMFEDPASLHTAEVTGNSDTNSTSPGDNNVLEQNITNNMSDRKDVIININDNLQINEHSIVELSNKINCDNSIQTISLIEPMMLPKMNNCNEIITIDDDVPELVEQYRKRKLNISENINALKSEHVDGDKPKQRKLESVELPEDENGSDSDVTVVYDLEEAPSVSPINNSSPYKRFSPLPSTSTDNATFLKNDKIFMECLSANSSSIETEASNIFVTQESPIIIDDDYDDLPSVIDNAKSSTAIEIPQPVVSIDDDVVGANNIIVDEIDIDEIISCNRTLLTKYRTVENLPAVIEVAPVESITTSKKASNTIEIIDSPLAKRQNTDQRVPSAGTATDYFSISSTSQRDMTSSNTISTNDLINVSHNPTTSANVSRKDIVTNASQRNISSIYYDQSTNSSSLIAHQTSTPQTNFITPNSIINTSMANISQSPEVSTGLNCPICLDNLRATECASTLCGHIFCMSCIKRALRSSRRCPTCRKTIKGNNGYHRLFL